MNDGLTKHQRYGRSAKGKARDARHYAAESHRDSHAAYNASTKGMVRRTRTELTAARQRRAELAQED